MKCIFARLCGRLFCPKWRWRCDLVNFGKRSRQGDALVFTWNYVGGRLLLLRISGGRGTIRNRFWSGNSAGLWLFVIEMALLRAA